MQLSTCVFCHVADVEIELWCLNCVPRCACCSSPTTNTVCGLSSFHCSECECFCPICGNSCRRHKYSGDPNDENYAVHCPSGCDHRFSRVSQPELVMWNEYGQLDDPLNQVNGILFCKSSRAEGSRGGIPAIDVE